MQKTQNKHCQRTIRVKFDPLSQIYYKKYIMQTLIVNYSIYSSFIIVLANPYILLFFHRVIVQYFIW